MKALVIPTIRSKHLHEFLCAWHDAGDWDLVVLVEGNATRTFNPRGRWPIEHVSRAEIEADLGPRAWIISQGDSACRCFGFLKAVELGAEWILNLDDDCLPAGVGGQRPETRDAQASSFLTSDLRPPAPICAAHLAAMQFPLCQSPAGELRTRGLPYRNRGELRSLLNMGLWSGVPDVDGPQGLLQFDRPPYEPPAGSTLAHPAARYPLCGMNLFFHRSLLPALFFPLMGTGQPYKRFDDIWAGWIFQRVAQQCGIAWSFGEPHIFHSRASDPFKNLIAEAPGIELNERFWERINAIELTARDVAGATSQIAADLAGDELSYLRDVGRALAVWVELAAEAGARGQA